VYAQFYPENPPARAAFAPMLQTLQTALKGPAQAWAQHRQLVKGYTGIESGLAAIQSVCPAPKDDSSAPIFLLSAGWRSGSTLLQRLIMSDKHARSGCGNAVAPG
ncbi:MAG: hypothetical protein R6W91_06285, partial [Thermoplasmata archaeon]